MGVFVVYALWRRRRNSNMDIWTNIGNVDLQNDKLAGPDGQDGKQGEADDEAGESTQIARPKDQQTVPPAYY